MKKLKRKIYKLFYGKSYGSMLFNNVMLIFNVGLIFLVLASSFYPKNKLIISVELFLGILFLLEYLLRFWVSRDKFLFPFKLLNIVDLLVILSLFSPIFLHNLGFLRIVRSLQILRLYNVSSFGVRGHKHNKFLVRNKEVVTGVLNLIVFVFLMSSLVYSFQVSQNPGINNYVDAMYFTLSTLTTTGFGDITPAGTEGRILVIVIMIFGITLFIRLAKSIFKKPKNFYTCKTCGLKRHDFDAIHCKHCGEVIKNAMLDY